MAGLTEGEKKDECVKFSLKLRAAWSLSNYHRFFKLYRTAPKMAAYLVDWFADRERKQAMRAMLKGFVYIQVVMVVVWDISCISYLSLCVCDPNRSGGRFWDICITSLFLCVCERKIFLLPFYMYVGDVTTGKSKFNPNPAQCNGPQPNKTYYTT